MMKCSIGGIGKMDKEKVKVFISQPMNGLSDIEILNRRENAIVNIVNFLNKEGYKNIEIIDTFFELGESAKPLHYLSKSLECLADCDVAYFLKGWSNARGCNIEEICAREYGIKKVVYEL